MILQEEIEQWLGTNLLAFGNNIRSWQIVLVGDTARLDLVINQRVANSSLFNTQLNNVIEQLKSNFSTITFYVQKTNML